MLIQAVEQTTDDASENALQVSITFKQIIIVDVQSAQLKTQNLADPAQTAPVINNGSVQPKPVTQSILSTLFGN
jgi:hypothetical protein